MLNSHDKLTIRMINQQMKELHTRGTSDADMLKTLCDFVSDVKYIVKASGKKEMRMHLKESIYFAYFSSLVQGIKPKPLK
tara:strand:+ start:761 stop:1000 length:240 start_codon:yes stop_codon:yes gene_type:complete